MNPFSFPRGVSGAVPGNECVDQSLESRKMLIDVALSLDGMNADSMRETSIRRSGWPSPSRTHAG